MPIYRLAPLMRDDASWAYSVEKTHVWAGALTPDQARALVAAKTGFYRLATPEAVSPWLDTAVTSCEEESSMSYPERGEVIREDGSRIAD